MELGASGLKEQPFRIHGKPLFFVSYEAQQNAHAFLQDICNHPTGIGLFRGPPLSGKTTIIQEFVAKQTDDSDIAVVAANHAKHRPKKAASLFSGLSSCK